MNHFRSLVTENENKLEKLFDPFDGIFFITYAKNRIPKHKIYRNLTVTVYQNKFNY